MPASQLSDINYPKIDDGDKDKIIEALKRLVGQRVQMSILVANPKEGKLIFTQKNLNRQVDSINDAGSVNNTTTNVLSNHIVGEEVEGMVTGMVEFGIFIKMDDGTEGLIHKSEIA
ncbi:MAG: S1 RNA-binding domain-containing protein [Candidatus Pacebacteria bacterium]|nr:S1 RNA-binding domain-containing protein [Candidatus Paceibacterota bacterium]